MRTASLAAIVLLFTISLARAAEPAIPKPTGESIVSPDAKLELLFTRSAKIEGGLTEGPGARDVGQREGRQGVSRCLD